MNISGSVGATYSISEPLAYGFAKPTAVGSDTATCSFGSGTTAGNIDLHWEKGVSTTLSLTASGTVTYTLSALSSTNADDLGRSVAFAKVAVFWVRITNPSSTVALTLAPGATHGFVGLSSAAITIKNTFVWADTTGGLAVGSGATDQITITNTGSTTVNFTIGIAGTSV